MGIAGFYPHVRYADGSTGFGAGRDYQHLETLSQKTWSSREFRKSQTCSNITSPSA
jgi:hypothetical protein